MICNQDDKILYVICEEKKMFGSLLLKFIEKIIHRFDASRCEELIEA